MQPGPRTPPARAALEACVHTYTYIHIYIACCARALGRHSVLFKCSFRDTQYDAPSFLNQSRRGSLSHFTHKRVLFFLQLFLFKEETHRFLDVLFWKVGGAWQQARVMAVSCCPTCRGVGFLPQRWGQVRGVLCKNLPIWLSQWVLMSNPSSPPPRSRLLSEGSGRPTFWA